MKKLLLIALAVLMVLSCTSCSHGDVDWQTQAMEEYVNTYHDEFEIVDIQSDILDTVTTFTLKDKKDGFTYSVVTTEVYWSDLGFAETGSEKTILFDSTFHVNYLSYLIQEKADREELQTILDKYSDIELDLAIVDVSATQMEAVDIVFPEVLVTGTSVNLTALAEVGAFIKKYDTRNLLSHVEIAMYTYANGELSDSPLAYYDFFLNVACLTDKWDGVLTLREYMFYQNKTDITVSDIAIDVASSSITLPDGMSWADNVDDSGTLLTFWYQEEQYQLYTLPCVAQFEGHRDEYGIYENSFLDIMASEESGNKPLIVAMYTIMYPEEYTSLTLYCQKITTNTEVTE